MPTPIKPRRTAEKHWKGKDQPLVAKEQDATKDTVGDRADWGDLPNSGPHEAGAGGDEQHGGPTKGFGKAYAKPAAGPKRGRTSHHKGPEHPEAQFSGGKTEHDPIGHDPPGDDSADHSTGHARAGSIDTLTRLIFHPAGGMGHHQAAHTPHDSPNFHDSGHRSETPEIAKREVAITRGRAKQKAAR